MTETNDSRRRDWAGGIGTFVVAWGLPSLAIIAGSLLDEPARIAIWAGALIWMGSACLMNARRCGRTHCRFTGPFYLMMIIPVSLHGFGLLPLGPHAWWILGGIILLGGKVVWWVTEAIWGKFATPR